MEVGDLVGKIVGLKLVGKPVGCLVLGREVIGAGTGALVGTDVGFDLIGATDLGPELTGTIEFCALVTGMSWMRN